MIPKLVYDAQPFALTPPGDVQFVDAIGRPPSDSPFALERWTNCLVFSSTGDRSVPSMLAGGDLDGMSMFFGRVGTNVPYRGRI